MPYPPILRDQNGDPIPQIWDGANWKPYKANTPLVITHQNAAAANGNGVAADVDGYGSAMFQVTGTFNAKVNFEGSVDGVNYVPIFALDSSGSRVSSATAPGIFRADIAGLKSIRAPISNYVSGAVTVVSRALPVGRPVEQSVSLNGSTATEGGTPPIQIVAIGGRYDLTPRSIPNGKHGAIALTPEGRVIVEMMAQDYQLFNNTTVTAGATITSNWIDGNGYNAAGLYVEYVSGENNAYQYALHMSPSPNGSPYAMHSDGFKTPLYRNIVDRLIIGHTKYIRLVVKNTDTVDHHVNAWLQLIF